MFLPQGKDQVSRPYTPRGKITVNYCKQTYQR
jgi:hypothetical protein